MPFLFAKILSHHKEYEESSKITKIQKELCDLCVFFDGFEMKTQKEMCE
jgi:hypothetical protein